MFQGAGQVGQQFSKANLADLAFFPFPEIDSQLPRPTAHRRPDRRIHDEQEARRTRTWRAVPGVPRHRRGRGDLPRVRPDRRRHGRATTTRAPTTSCRRTPRRSSPRRRTSPSSSTATPVLTSPTRPSRTRCSGSSSDQDSDKACSTLESAGQGHLHLMVAGSATPTAVTQQRHRPVVLRRFGTPRPGHRRGDDRHPARCSTSGSSGGRRSRRCSCRSPTRTGRHR